MQSLNSVNYKHLEEWEAIDKIIERQNNRNQFLVLLTKFVGVCLRRKIRMIFENPITGSFLNNYFLKEPTIKDNNRMLRGDYFVKPTGFCFLNCNPTAGFTEQYDKEKKTISKSKSAAKAGICSEERSMISPDYARNFICDFILGKEQLGTQLNLF